jgi:large subunit ribosomal protein L4
MQSNVVDLRGSVVRAIELDERVFGIAPNAAVVHQAVVTQQANARQGTHDTRTRGEVAGGGKKPYRQKGTGYARQGSTRAPHYRTGGIVFGPHPRSYDKALPRKMRRLAMRSVLSARAADQSLLIVDNFSLPEPKTRVLLSTLATLGAGDGAVVVLGERSDAVWRAARNLERVHVVTPNGLNLLDILRLPRLVLTEAAVQQLTRTLTSDLAPAGAAPRASSSEPRQSAERPARGKETSAPPEEEGPIDTVPEPDQGTSGAAPEAAPAGAGQGRPEAEPPEEQGPVDTVPEPDQGQPARTEDTGR